MNSKIFKLTKFNTNYYRLTKVPSSTNPDPIWDIRFMFDWSEEVDKEFPLSDSPTKHIESRDRDLKKIYTYNDHKKAWRMPPKRGRAASNASTGPGRAKPTNKTNTLTDDYDSCTDSDAVGGEKRKRGKRGKKSKSKNNTDEQSDIQSDRDLRAAAREGREATPQSQPPPAQEPQGPQRPGTPSTQARGPVSPNTSEYNRALQKHGKVVADAMVAFNSYASRLPPPLNTDTDTGTSRAATPSRERAREMREKNIGEEC